MSGIQNIPLIQLAGDTATTLVNSYYPALNSLNVRTQLASYYIPNAAIVWNGNAITGGEDFASVFASMSTSTYDPQSFDAQPISTGPNVSTGTFSSVSGSVRYREEKDLRTFKETFVLRGQTRQNGRLLSRTPASRRTKVLCSEGLRGWEICLSINDDDDDSLFILSVCKRI